ncbi:dTDP-glucose 4,6-dehydratase [Candidatus Gottesmanbacteria bacterium]|nr:dTDP-glucose 4,6-dehydratase [Candidatus Gottesmanbacteria bacterium]
MKLLVTGGAGFIGSNFILYWLKKYPDDQIINLDKLTYAGNLDNLKEVTQNPNYSFVKGDICQPATVAKAMDGVDIIVHFAAESHVDRSIKAPSIFVTTNVAGTQVLLDVAVKKQIKRFHHISTDEVFGSIELTDTSKFDENSTYNPASPYAASKAAADHLVRAYGKTYNLPYSISNCSNNFGPYQYPEKFIPLAIISAILGKKVPIYGDGLYIRDWLYVSDHCRAIDLIIHNPNTLHKTYCIGGLTKDISNRQVVEKILKLFGKDSEFIEFVPDRPGHDRKYAIDWKKIKADLGWQPEKNFDTYLGSTVQWYKTNRNWWQKLLEREDPRVYYGQD